MSTHGSGGQTGPELPPGSIRPTPASTLAAAFVLGGVLGYAVVVVSEALAETAPLIQWTSLIALFVISGVVGGLAFTTNRTVQQQRRLIPAQRAVNLLMLAKASALVGAVVAGGYLGFAIPFLDALDAPLPRERVLRAAVAAVLGVTIVIGGVLLERACRIPPGGDE